MSLIFSTLLPGLGLVAIGALVAFGTAAFGQRFNGRTVTGVALAAVIAYGITYALMRDYDGARNVALAVTAGGLLAFTDVAIAFLMRGSLWLMRRFVRPQHEELVQSWSDHAPRIGRTHSPSLEQRNGSWGFR